MSATVSPQEQKRLDRNAAARRRYHTRKVERGRVPYTFYLMNGDKHVVHLNKEYEETHFYASQKLHELGVREGWFTPSKVECDDDDPVLPDMTVEPVFFPQNYDKEAYGLGERINDLDVSSCTTWFVLFETSRRFAEEDAAVRDSYLHDIGDY